MKRMIVDISNLFWRTIAATQKYKSTSRDSAELGLHMCLLSMRKHFKQVQPDELVVAFEGSNNWRKAYTKSEQCYSKRIYKANRVKDPNMEILGEVLSSFKEMAIKHTSLIVLHNPLVEGDDLVAGYVQRFKDDELVILSGDKDYLQLLTSPNITLRNPDSDHPRSLDEYDGDAKYFMFEKCFRGDLGDNVMSAFPRVRSAKLKKAYTDHFELTNLLNSTWDFVIPETGEKRVMSVRDLYNENSLLMDLTKQPEHIQQIIQDTITEAITNKGKFNLMKFHRFLGENELEEISKNYNDYMVMFSLGQKKNVLTEEPVKKSIFTF